MLWGQRKEKCPVYLDQLLAADYLLLSVRMIHSLSNNNIM